MIIAWLNGREAAEIGTALADEFALGMTSAVTRRSPQSDASESIGQLLRRADATVRPLRLNFYKKAKFANSFKWRLIERGVAREIADGVTQSLVLHLSQNPVSAPSLDPAAAPAGSPDRTNVQRLFHRGNKSLAQGAYAEAAGLFEEALEIDPSHAEALNNLGASLSHLGRYVEAEQCFRRSIAIKPSYADAHGNLGYLLRLKGDLVGAEAALRYALKLKPSFTDARVNLGLTLTSLSRLRDAKACFAKALKATPRNTHALHGMGQIATLEGRFEEADATFRRIIEFDPRMPKAWAALAGIRKMTHADGEWFKRAEEIATSAIHPLEEADLRFAMGKYCDDVNDFDRAFPNFKRGNELLSAAAAGYDRKERSSLIDDLSRVYSRDGISKIAAGGSSSSKPVFVVGMPRSGTSLAEQIIASHPAAYGAGELLFWELLVLREAGVKQDFMSESARSKAADQYLRILEGHSASASSTRRL
jgi:tetratricopeptide (TPR) repeat protein